MKSIFPALLALVLFAACGNEEGGQDQSSVTAPETPVVAPFTGGHFAAALPCADCSNHRLNVQLWHTGSAFVRDEKIGTPEGNTLQQSWCRWKKDGDKIILSNDGVELHSFTVKDNSTISWDGFNASEQPNANELSLAQGILTPSGSVTIIGRYHTPDHPKVAYIRECNSGKNLLVKLKPEAADVHSRFEDLNTNPVEGAPVEVTGTMRTVPKPDKETGGDEIMLTIESWSQFLPDHNCPMTP